MFPENDRDNITSKFVENINNEQTEELIKELDLDIQTENDNNAIHASYSIMTGILIVAIATLLVVIKRQRRKKKKKKRKIQSEGQKAPS